MNVTIMGQEVDVRDDKALTQLAMLWAAHSVAPVPDAKLREAFVAFLGEIMWQTTKIDAMLIVLEANEQDVVPVQRLKDISNFSRTLLGLNDPQIIVPTTYEPKELEDYVPQTNARVEGSTFDEG